jgi:PAS domain S-box-containing protein
MKFYNIGNSRMEDVLMADERTYDELKQRVRELEKEAVESKRAERDITELKKTEEMLRESEEKLWLLVNNAHDVIWSFDLEKGYTFMSPSCEKIIGYPPEKYLNDPGFGISITHPEDLPKLNKLFADLQAGKEPPRTFELCQYHKDGHLVHQEFTFTATRDKAGNIVSLDGVSREITDRKRAEETLQKREEELKAQSHHLKEVNTALKVLLKQREEDKKDLEENVLSNVKQLVTPHLQRLKKSRLDADQRALLSTLESNLNNIVSPFVSKLSSKFLGLTPTEIRVADFVKEGKTNKEIGEILCLSPNTVKFHRYNLRSKLGLKNRKKNLRSYLLSLQI